MERPNVIVVQNEADSAATLIELLQTQCRSVHIARSTAEARASLPKHRASILIADLDLMRLIDIEQVHSEFGNVRIICTHRVADEQMWADSLHAGAADCCNSQDAHAIVTAALNMEPRARSKAA